jgi:hypothetical protein
MAKTARPYLRPTQRWRRCARRAAFGIETAFALSLGPAIVVVLSGASVKLGVNEIVATYLAIFLSPEDFRRPFLAANVGPAEVAPRACGGLCVCTESLRLFNQDTATEQDGTTGAATNVVPERNKEQIISHRSVVHSFYEESSIVNPRHAHRAPAPKISNATGGPIKRIGITKKSIALIPSSRTFTIK